MTADINTKLLTFKQSKKSFNISIMTGFQTTLKLPASSRMIAPGLAFIRQLAADCGFDETNAGFIELATEEALINVIRHAYGENPSEHFELQISVTPSELILRIHEKGMPFLPEKIREYRPEELASTKDAGGLGMFLMKQAMDSIVYENLGRDGKALTMIKNMPDTHILSMMEKETPVESPAEIPAETQKISPVVRSFETEDAIEISRCAYKAYGYTYEPYIYYPAKISEMNTEGYLRSYVAVDRNSGSFMGHMAFKFSDPGDRIAEMGVAFVKPEYRKFGVFKELNRFCHEKALETGLYAYFARAVTSHVASQATAQSIGYITCGLYLGLFPDDVEFKSLSGKVKQKESAVLLYKHLHDDGERVVFTAERYRGRISRVFGSVGIPFAFGDGRAPEESVRSRMKVNSVPVLNVSDIVVELIGSDIQEAVKTQVHELCLRHTDVIFIHISLEDAASPGLVEFCNGLGFIFCGLLPYGHYNRHRIILQYLNNLDIDFSVIQTCSEESQEIVRSISEESKLNKI